MPGSEGYSVNVVIIIARYGAPNSADCPLKPSIAAAITLRKRGEQPEGKKAWKRRCLAVKKFESLAVDFCLDADFTWCPSRDNYVTGDHERIDYAAL